jgi:hypothetical protein
MRIISAWAIYLCILCGALNGSQSTSGWVLLGLAPVLWLDRYVFRLLPWPGRAAFVSAVLLRLGIFVAAGGLLYWLGSALGAAQLGDRAGNREAVTPFTALMSGLVATMSLFLIELALDGGVQLAERLRPRQSVRRSFSLTSLAVIAFVGLTVFVVSPLQVFHPLVSTPVLHPGLHQPPLAYEEVRFQSTDGLELAGWWVPTDEAQGTVIFCHGHQGNRQQGHGLLPHLHDLRLNVLTFDFRGHGCSAPAPAGFGLNEVRDFWAAEAYAARRAPDKPIYVFGVSYGARDSLIVS